ncbi:MAG: InlB B-repeat-containing protein [Tannerella sp.]|nr:InlB B-repeat-containing protein [Tannerella sp.]
MTIEDDEPRPAITTSLQDAVYNTGEIVPALNLASDIAGATITWTNSNPAIGLAASGTGNIPSFTATNTSATPITATISVKATKECTGITKTFTITVNSKFNITYNYNGGVAPSTANPTDFLVASLPMNIVNAPTRTGYTFAGWTCAALGITTPENPFTIPAGTIQHVALTADWGSGANVYNITFTTSTGITNPNTNRTYTYEDNVSIANPTIPGFTFKGWTIVNDEASSPAINPKKNVSWTQHTVYGNLQFSATAPTLGGSTTPSVIDTTNWSPNKYTITYDYDGGVAPEPSNPTTYNTLTAAINLSAPTRSGYTFRGWTITSSESAVSFLPLTQVIPTGSYGNLTCKANWGENGYTISYQLNGAVHPQTPIAYSFTDRVTVANPTLVGYTFKGWTITNTESASPAITPTKNVTFGPSTVFGNLTFTAPAPPASGGGNSSWDQITYNITYNLNGGSHGASHPNTYKVTDNVSISVPTKAGYTFAGWTIVSDSLTSPLPTSGNPTTTFGPSNGIYGNLIFTATWSTDAYTITYNPGAADASFTNNTNPGTYNIEDTPISLTDAGAKRNGYTFAGWNIVSSVASVTIPDGMAIPANTHGNLTSTAKWTINNYNITFSVPAMVSNPNSNRTYTYEDDVTIANPTIPGYTFAGWTIVNDEASSPAIAPINSAWAKHTVYGNMAFSVTDPTTDPTNWSMIEYNITYDLNGGTPPATANPTQYNVQTPAITLNAPTRTGYTFTGWTITGDSLAVTFTNPTNAIPTGSYGNLTCRANWGINPYAITYSVAPGITHSQTPTGYTFEDAVTIANPILTGYTFSGWTITNDAPSAPAIAPTKNVSWSPNTVFGNLTMKVEYPTGDSTTNWTKNKYAVIYNQNGGSGAVTVDSNSPYIWGRTVTVLGKASGMVYTNAMYLGWASTTVALITTQAQEDAVVPTLTQAGNTFAMPYRDTTFYAVWAIDANGPGGGPDGTPDYKQVAINYLPSSSVAASSGTYPANVMFNKNSTGTVSGNTGNLQATKKILMGWSTNNVPSISATGSLPANMYSFGAPISLGTTDITLYAVWADDNNGNGTPDFKETTSTTPEVPTSPADPGTRPSRPGARSLALGSEIHRPEMGSSLMTRNMMTRSSNDVWADWKSDWDIRNVQERAFADDCRYDYVIAMDTLRGSRAYYDMLYPGDPFPPYYYESWVEEDSWLYWSYEGDWNSIRDSFVINGMNNISGDAYEGAGQFLDSVFIPGQTYLASDYVMNMITNEIVHSSSVKADLASGNYDVSEYYPGKYDPFVKFNADLITEALNGGELRITYKVRAVSGNPMGSYGGGVTLFKHIYKRFEPVDEIVSQYVSPAGRWDVSINYGTRDLKRSINGAAWNNAYAPLTSWEQLCVNDGGEIRLRDPGDECGKIIYFNHILTPVTQRRVMIHSMDGIAKVSPAADMDHYVEGHKDFTFAMSFTDKALKVIAQQHYSGNKQELIGDSIGEKTYQYTIPQVVEPMDVYITNEPASATSNDVIGNLVNVWAYGNTLYIRNDGATKANIYSLSGLLLKQLNLTDIITQEVMERGVYVIELDSKHYKVIIR